MSEIQYRNLGEVHPTPLMRIYGADNGFIITIYQGPGCASKEYVAYTPDDLAALVKTLAGGPVS